MPLNIGEHVALHPQLKELNDAFDSCARNPTITSASNARMACQCVQLCREQIKQDERLWNAFRRDTIIIRQERMDSRVWSQIPPASRILLRRELDNLIVLLDELKPVKSAIRMKVRMNGFKHAKNRRRSAAENKKKGRKA